MKFHDHPMRVGVMLAFPLIAMLHAVALADDDPLDAPPPPSAVKKQAPPKAELPAGAGPAQQEARFRWKPWEQEDRPGPKRLPEMPEPSVMKNASAKQDPPARKQFDPPARKQPEPLKPIPRDELNPTPKAAMPMPTLSRLPQDQSLMLPADRPPTRELEVFPAPPRDDGPQIDMPIAPPMLGDISPYLPANNLRFQRAIVHQLGASRFKIADNNSPLPDRRGLASFNYFNNPYEQTGRFYKGTSGFEWTWLDRHLSLDVRGGAGLYTNDFDSNATFATNPSAVVKALFLESGSFQMSGGFGVSFPSWDSPEGAEETDFVFSPFLAWIWASRNSAWFLHGFEQWDIPTSGGEMRLQSDVGVGYWIRRDDPTKLITAWAPTAELHLYTPFEGSPDGDREGLPSDHVLNGTLGATFYFGPTDSLAIGVGAPLLGSKHYEWEGHLHFIHRF
jgi:hypothetical protein